MRSSFAGTESWEQLDWSAKFIVKAPPAVLARGMLGMLKYDATNTLREIPVPALVIGGDRDPTCKPEASEHMLREIPQARGIMLTPARHLGLVEHHARFAQEIHAFSATCLEAVARV
jgi:pimeloyl-ACP methyl ester carboxylesterase